MKLLLKFLVLFATLAPMVWLLYYTAGGKPPSTWHVEVGVMTSVSIVVFVHFLVNILRNSKLSDHSKVIWVVLMLMLATPVQVVYWYRWILRS